jgi:hypothetical protein
VHVCGKEGALIVPGKCLREGICMAPGKGIHMVLGQIAVGLNYLGQIINFPLPFLPSNTEHNKHQAGGWGHCHGTCFYNHPSLTFEILNLHIPHHYIEISLLYYRAVPDCQWVM